MCLFFLQNKVCHAEKYCDLSNLAHIYLTVILMLNSHEVIQKSFYFLCLFELCMCPEECFFWLMT